MGAREARQVRPRYGRIGLAASSTTVTVIAVLGGVGALPSAANGPDREEAIGMVAQQPAQDDVEAVGPRRELPPGVPTTPAVSDAEGRAASTELPGRSGDGKRVVFSEGRQRVWLVAADGDVKRTYLVSGSLHDNLDPGTYEVYSRSEQAWGIDDSGSMKYFVRFATGDNAAIGFHDIPIDDGARVQTVDQLGTPLSHGCIRQRRADAKVLWEFAPLGTTVVVTA